MSRSRLIQALCLVAAIAISANVVHCDNINVAQANLKTTSVPIVIKTTPGAIVVPAAPPSNSVVHSITTIKPASHNNAVLKQEVLLVPQVTVAPAGLQSSTAKPVVVVSALSPVDRISQYFEPICSQLDKLQPKQMFKIQSQLKKFVEKTSGKMSPCFMQTYSIDPNVTPVNKEQLQTICGSRKLDLSAKGSFKSFLDCAGRHYDPALDAELARIHKSRAHLGVDLDHSKDNLANLPHDDDELSLISEVVNKVMADSKVSTIKGDIKIVDLNAATNNAAAVPIVVKTTASPVAAGSKPSTAIPVVKLVTVTQAPSLAERLKPSSSPAQKLSNDSNKMLLIVDDAAGNVSTKPPQKSGVVVIAQTTVAPKQVAVTTLLPVKLVTTTAASKGASSATTAKPAEIKLLVTTPASAKSSGLSEKIVAAAGAKTTTTLTPSHPTKALTVTTAAPKKSSTAAPVTGGPKTTAAAALKTTVAPSTGKPTAASTKKPEGGSTAAPKSTFKPTAAATDAAKTTNKPIKKDAKEPKKQEKEKDKKVAKKEDDLDAKKAIKSLQAERAQAHGSPADIRMHQIEHERQMSIDPLGHTKKHQEYEKKKAAVSATKTSTTTKKPQ